MNTAVAVTLAIFVVGCVFAAGRLTARVESLEAWRMQMNGELSSIHAALRRLAGLIKGEEV